MAVWLLSKKLGKSYEDMSNDLENCGNPIFRIAYETLKETSDKVLRGFQKKTTLQLGTVLIWILYRDTAYKDIAYDALHSLITNNDLQTTLKDYIKPPNEWHVNVWHKSKLHTEELKSKGKLGYGQVSPDEEIFVPSKQRKKLKKL